MMPEFAPGGPETAAETMRLYQRLKAWSNAIGAGSGQIVGDLSEIHAAATAIRDRIELLSADSAPDAATSRKLLVEIDAWLNDELADHRESLNAVLPRVIDSLYAVE